jgi:DNA-binding NtrC family response regulator
MTSADDAGGGGQSQLGPLKVLHLDDDPFELERVQRALEKNAVPGAGSRPFKVESVATVQAYRQRLAVKPAPDVALLDIHIGDHTALEGVALAGETRRLLPDAAILMCSTADDVGTIADCLSAGADDFISKLTDKGELSLRVFNSWRLAKLKHGGDSGAGDARGAAKGKLRPVGATMEKIARRVPLIIDSAISAVFIRGESGTGKEVVADLFGSALPGSSAFVKVNCGAIAPTLLESELFGHVKGAFTGAMSDKRGLIEAASGGWIFLDEVATLSPSAQVALLRVVENQEVLRVGATKPTSVHVRVISATNEPVEQLVKQGRFRADLWQRLREAEVTLPPLRDRPGEIKALIEHFCASMPGGPYQVSGPVMDVLTSVAWRDGNIRELRNCLRAMTEMHLGKLLTPLSIPERIWEEVGDKPPPATAAAAASDGGGANFATAPVGSMPASAPAADLHLKWDPAKEEQNYDYLADALLLEVTRKLANARGKLSLRGLSQAIGMSRSTLSGRLKGLVHRNIVDLAELSRLVGISADGQG